MPAINLILDGDRCWPYLDERGERGQLIALMGDSAPPIGVALLAGGMTSGKASVTFRIELPDGRTLITETSLALLRTAVQAMCAKVHEHG